MATFSRDVPLDQPVYTRAGVALRSIRINENIVDSHFGHIRIFTVLSQSIPERTTVAKGTAVDVTMAITGTLPLEVLPNIPERWSKIPLQMLAENVRKEPEILQLMAKHESIETLDEGEVKMVAAFLEKSGLPDAQENLSIGFDAARASHLLVGG